MNCLFTVKSDANLLSWGLLAVACILGALCLSCASRRAGESSPAPRPGVPPGSGGSAHRVSVMDFGARGDGRTDDTAAIQAAINHIAKIGGGVVFFPFTREGYILGSPAVETVDGRAAKSQIYIPKQNYPDTMFNISLEGEMPVKHFDAYILRPGVRLNGLSKCNTRLISTWEAPEQTDPALRPYSLLSAVEGDWHRGKLGAAMVSIKNLEFRAFMNPEKMYPTGSCVNLQNASRCIVQDSCFALDKNVGDLELGLELQPTKSYTAGLIMPGDQSDTQMLRNVSAQGFRYGFVLGEMLVADYLSVTNCDEAIMVHGFTELSHIQFVVSMNNRIIVSAMRQPTFGMVPPPRKFMHVSIGLINFEHCRGEKGNPEGSKPRICNTQYGVYDPDNRIRGRLQWYCGWPPNDAFFPVEGGKNMDISRFYTPRE
ncbi:MAG: Pectate lyase superfamily protein [Planctomycetes bacterium ADurb.Bin412]|nr:MAG: Pectate lyase superfamily protein [Planctomycetes bacterium ADurb.Bin412]